MLIDALDAEMAVVGLSRYGAVPGLNAIKGRDVLYANYRFNLSDKSWFLSADDVQKVGTIELRVYSAAMDDEQARRKAIVRVDSVLAAFGAKLTLRAENSKD